MVKEYTAQMTSENETKVGPDYATRLVIVISGFVGFLALWLLLGRRLVTVPGVMFVAAAAMVLADAAAGRASSARRRRRETGRKRSRDCDRGGAVAEQ